MTLHLHHVEVGEDRAEVAISDYRTVVVARQSDDIVLFVMRNNGLDRRAIYLTNADAQALIDALHSVRGGTHA